MRRAALPVPLVHLTVGSLLAHELSYRLVAPDEHVRAAVLHASGHAYLRHAPAALGLLLALLPVSLAAHAVGRRGSWRPCWPLFVALPVLGFAVQEHLERWAATGALPLDAATEPTFLLGVALQLPFALAALVATRLLLRAAERLAVGVRGGRRPTRAVRPPRPRAALHRAARARPRVTGLSQRGPPRPAPARS